MGVSESLHEYSFGRRLEIYCVCFETLFETYAILTMNLKADIRIDYSSPSPKHVYGKLLNPNAWKKFCSTSK